MSALRPPEPAEATGVGPSPDRSDYDGSRAPTDMAIDSDDSRLGRFERRDDR
jgi:hypothetical protein